MFTRDLQATLVADLERHDKMLFVAGPRQTGKTTLAKMLMETRAASRYWNHDIPEDRLRLTRAPSFFQEIDRARGVKPLVVFDELHRYRQWKAYLKGAFDDAHADFSFLVTGSGRLDLYRTGGDSLAGRYFLHRLFPLTIGELATVPRRSLEEFLGAPDELPAAAAASRDAWRSLDTLSGFPEPFTTGDESFYRRWAQTYRHQVIREDIRDLTHVHQVSQIETLAALLRERVGALLSTNALREDLKTAFDTVKNWLEILQNFYVVFLLTPWQGSLVRALRKEPKLYFYDWAAVHDPAARFENLVAVHLLRAVTAWTEAGAGEFALHFVRDREKSEVDFLLVRGKEPLVLVEAKLQETEPAPALIKMKRALGVPAVQLVNTPGISRRAVGKGEGILVASAERWLAGLP